MQMMPIYRQVFTDWLSLSLVCVCVCVCVCEFSDHFIKFVICYKRRGYNIDVIKQPACTCMFLPL